MKKRTLIAAFIAVFSFSACSDNASSDHDNQHASMSDEEPAAGKVVVEAPAYDSVAEPMQRNVSQLLDEYIKLKDAMVASDAAASQTAAGSLLEMANAMPVATLTGEQKSYAEARVDEIKQSATKMAASADLGEQRQQLESLSEATFALTKAFGATDQKLYYQHCPMAFNDNGAYWISNNKEIRNPYYGESMLKCGTNEEVYN